jgi:DTW domain-containing protein YfiP
VVVLQHPRERDMPVNTARIASLCLPAAEVHVGLRLPDARVLRDPRRPAALLYPGPGAVDVEQFPPPTEITLVVVDGTWSQAKKLVRLNPELAALPRYAFRPPAPSEYRIRREPREDFVSTLEALVHVLGVLEGDRDRFLPMLRPFRAMVEAQIAFAGSNCPRVRHPRARAPADPRARLPPVLRDRPRDLVCVHAEANAWPYGAAERASCPEELVHWVARRPATGESFEAIVAPRHALCPKTAWHLGIPATALLQGTTTDALHERWARFSRPDDVVCAWGTHPLALFEAAGGVLPAARVDLRRAARAYSNVAVGTMDAFRESLEVEAPAPCASGRAGTRLATLAAIASLLAS